MAEVGKRYVPGSGRTNHRLHLMGVGEAPGREEERYGKVFIGPTGKEMRRLYKQAGLEFDWFYHTNVSKYRPDSDKATGNTSPTLADIERDTPDLKREIRRVKPKWIVAIGRIAARWFLEDDVDMEDVEGFAFPDCPRARGAVVIPVRHPAAGFHSPEQQPIIYWDFQRLGQFVRGELEPVTPVDRYPDPDYYTDKGGVSVKNTTIAVDTEGRAGDIWSAQYSFIQGSAGLVLAKDNRAVNRFREMVFNNTVILHNAPYDLRIMAELFGMNLVELLGKVKIEDSMQAAYVLRLLPKGLKALCRRFHGMKMRDYKEVVREPDKRIMVEYFAEILRARCKHCAGAGTVLHRPMHKSSGKLLPERPVKCDTCGGDGTSWQPPPEVLEWRNGRLTVSRGHRMGSRVRGILADKDKVDVRTGKPTDLRQRYSKFRKDSFEFTQQVDDTLGSPRLPSLGDLPIDEARQYACADADGTLRMWPELEKELRSQGLWETYEIDKAIIPIATRMMEVGMKVDCQYLHRLTNRLTIQQDRILAQLESLLGHKINPNSPDQVGDVLFKRMGMHPVRLTDTGAESTDSKVLTDLRIHATAKMETSPRYRETYEFITLVLEYKERGKLKSTYTIPLPRMVDGNSRLHTWLKLTGTESGRLASADPNLQNIPNRTDLGKLIRAAFICEPGNVLVGVDLSQIEMRVLAHMSNEKLLIKAIRGGLDVHNLTCSKIFGIPIEDVRKDMWQRDAAKTLGFGIVYGISAAALKTQIKLQSGRHTAGGIDVPLEVCEGWIEDYTHRTYPAIGDFMADSQAEARRQGYVSAMFGHRRYLPGVHSPINKVRAESERIATNHIIQGTAAEIEKKGLAVIWDDVLPKYRKRGYCEPVLDEHDATYFECKREMAEDLLEEVVRVKCEVVRLKVPVTADGHTGMNWREVKDGPEKVKKATLKLTQGSARSVHA